MVDRTGAYRTLVEKPEGKTLGRPRCRWEKKNKGDRLKGHGFD
jgi:hypothetical protein